MTLLTLLLACSGPTEEPHLTPPIATTLVCVDVTPADIGARVEVNGKAMSDRCVMLESMYKATGKVDVKVTAEGYKELERSSTPTANGLDWSIRMGPL